MPFLNLCPRHTHIHTSSQEGKHRIFTLALSAITVSYIFEHSLNFVLLVDRKKIQACDYMHSRNLNKEKEGVSTAPGPLGAERDGVEIGTEGQSLGDLHTGLWSAAGTAKLVNILGPKEASGVGGGRLQMDLLQ